MTDHKKETLCKTIIITVLYFVRVSVLSVLRSQERIFNTFNIYLLFECSCKSSTEVCFFPSD